MHACVAQCISIRVRMVVLNHGWWTEVNNILVEQQATVSMP